MLSYLHRWDSRLLCLAVLFVPFLPGLLPAQEPPGLKPPATDSRAGSRPNMILIIADDVSATDIGCYGNADVRTPNLDRLAARGQMWSRAYLTATVCSPSRCSIITGRYPHNTGAPELHTALSEGQPMFPRQLQKAGYWTAQAGKWHLGNYAKKAFDIVIDDRDRNGASGCEYWIPLLRQRPKDKPFFLWLASHDAHRTWQPDPEAPPHDPQSIALPTPLVDTQSTRDDLAKYYDEVQRLDRFVGKVVAELKAQDILDNTLVLFIADNGRPFPRAKRWQTEEGMRTPWILHWPEGLGDRGRRCEQLVSVIDIAPTLLALAGAEIPDSVQGRSFLPQVADANAKICNYVFSERNWQVEYCHERTLRYGHWSYYRNSAPDLAHFGFVNATFPGYRFAGYVDLWRGFRSGKPLTDAQRSVFLQPRPREQLFNLEQDPMEVNDLANDPSQQKLLEQLRATMDHWVEQTGDSIPPKDRRTPDRHDRLTGKRLFEGGHPGPAKYEIPGQSAGATHINRPGPR
jgi:N-sulfoglucosamine sulfohydrolase